ncbi:hypothetical protein J6590_011524 [Homalodisca vitripennis]|nr:hypothetical protein J6590_011524 [Homalodisca vitripennis]
MSVTTSWTLGMDITLPRSVPSFTIGRGSGGDAGRKPLSRGESGQARPDNTWRTTTPVTRDCLGCGFPIKYPNTRRDAGNFTIPQLTPDGVRFGVRASMTYIHKPHIDPTAPEDGIVGIYGRMGYDGPEWRRCARKVMGLAPCFDDGLFIYAIRYTCDIY